MHTLFEGVVSNHLNLLFHHLIDESHSLCLGELNHAIDSHDYGYSEADTKPSPIHRESTAISDFKFKQPGTCVLLCSRKILNGANCHTIQNCAKIKPAYWHCAHMPANEYYT